MKRLTLLIIAGILSVSTFLCITPVALANITDYYLKNEKLSGQFSVPVNLSVGVRFAHRSSYATAINFPTGLDADSVAVGDFNSDSKLDLAVTNWFDNNVSVLLGNGNGSFGAATNFPVGTNPVFVVTGDVNGDSKLDLAVANFSSNNVSVLLGKW